MLWPAPPVPGERALVTGATRKGKSYWVWYQVFTPWQGSKVWVDPKGIDRYMVAPTYHSLEELQRAPSSTVLFRPLLGETREDFDGKLSSLSEYLLSYKRSYQDVPMLLVVDEAQNYMSKHGGAGWLSPWVDTMAGANVSVIALNPDHSTVPTHQFHQMSHFVMFDAHPVMLTYLEERLRTVVPDGARRAASVKYGGCRYDWERWYGIRPDGSDYPIEDAEKADEDREGGDTSRGVQEPQRAGAVDADPDDGDTDGDEDDGGAFGGLKVEPPSRRQVG